MTRARKAGRRRRRFELGAADLLAELFGELGCDAAGQVLGLCPSQRCAVGTIRKGEVDPAEPLAQWAFVVRLAEPGQRRGRLERGRQTGAQVDVGARVADDRHARLVEVAGEALQPRLGQRR
jgi:hypothetical protein